MHHAHVSPSPAHVRTVKVDADTWLALHDLRLELCRVSGRCPTLGEVVAALVRLARETGVERLAPLVRA